MNRLKFNQLYYFYVVAKEGSIKAASKKLHLTQPTISAQIKQLEEELGHELFERKHRKLELNPIGKVALKQSEAIFEMANHLQESLLSEGAQPIRDQFRVGAIQSLSNSFIYEFSPQLWADRTIQMEVHQGSLKELIQLLDAGELDMILTEHPFSNAKRYNSNQVPKSLKGVSYLGFSGITRFQQDVEFYFETENVQPELIGRVDDVTLMRIVTEQSACFSVMPYRAVVESIKAKRLALIGELGKGHNVGIWATYPVVSPSAPMVKRVLKSYFKRKS